MSKLVDNGWIDCNEEELFIHDWEEYRYYYNKYVSEKKQHSKRQREYVARKRAAEKATAKLKEQKEQKLEKTTVQEEKPVKKSQYTTSFETMWSVYPRKKDKGNAYKKYKARLNDGWSEEELLAAATAYATECKKNRTDEKYIKYASTFFSETTPFTDYLKKKEETAKQERTDGSNPFR